MCAPPLSSVAHTADHTYTLDSSRPFDWQDVLGHNRWHPEIPAIINRSVPLRFFAWNPPEAIDQLLLWIHAFMHYAENHPR